MKRNDRGISLIIVVIIVMAVLIVALGGFLVVKIVKNNKNKQQPQVQAPQQQVSTPTPPAEEPKLAVGDYVAYTPDGKSSYPISGNVTGDVESSTTARVEELEWRVLNINDDGTIDLIATETINTGIKFSGPVGFNNAVFLLNDLCEELYSNEELGAIGRSLNLEDIEKNMTEEALALRDEYGSDTAYGETKTYDESEVYIPDIYSRTMGENESESVYASATTDTLKTSSKLEAKQTFYGIADLNEEHFVNEEVYEIIFGDEIENWLATRGTDCQSDDYAKFAIMKVSSGTIGATVVLRSSGEAKSGTGYVRPVVTLSSDVEISLDNEGTAEDPREIINNNANADDNNDDDDDESGSSSMEETAKQMEIQTFNSLFSSYVGTNVSSAQCKSLLSAVLSSNSTNEEHQINATVNGDECTSAAAIGAAMQELNSSKKYTIEMAKDADGYINEITIDEQ